MGTATRETIRCPVSNHRLLDGFWVAEVLDIRLVCTCGRMVAIHKDYTTEIVPDYMKHRDRSTKES